MIATTLILTRLPAAFFQNSLFPTQHGRFGTLIAIQGTPVASVGIAPDKGQGSLGAIRVPEGILEITASDGGGIKEIMRFTTIERMDGFIQLKPQSYHGHRYKTGSYGLTYESGNPVVAKLKTTGGNCFRVLGGVTAQERAILIHEAPHVAYLEGCIGPRQFNDCSRGYTATAHSAMLKLFGINPRPSALFVLDW